MFIKVEEGGLFHRHHQGASLSAPLGVALGVESLIPFVNDGRWIVQCPDCGGSQLASPEMDRFFCVDCLNVGTDGNWIVVAWPDGVAAIEAALSARPDVRTRNWRPNETVGALLAENHMAGLVDLQAERVAGDIGYDQLRILAPAAQGQLS